jgi:hypothetical protein
LNENPVDAVRDWEADIRKVSKKAESDWPGVVRAEDLEQEVYLHILESPSTLRDLVAMNQTSRYRTLHKIAQRIASRERSDYELYSGNFRYSVGEVQSLLESAGDPERVATGSSWSVGGSPKGSGGHSDPTGSVGLSRVQLSESHKQLSEALASLQASNERQYDVLVERFVNGVVHGRSDMAASKMLERALISLTTRMNHAHKRKRMDIQSQATVQAYNTSGDGPGTRKPVRSSTARYITKESYDSDYTPAPTLQRDNHIEPEVWA